MYYHRLKLAYKGAQYRGWQIQAEGTTVQGELNKALALVAQNSSVRSIGSGRTDAGVHALGQVVRVEIPLSIASAHLLKALNTHLPPDIRVVSAEESHADFHPTFQAISKTYSYFFQTSPYPSPFLGDTVAHFSFTFDAAKAREACVCFIGTHDFTNFHTEGTETATKVRTIESCALYAHEPGHSPLFHSAPLYEIRVTGNGFLKQMVRMMVGAIWSAGRGKINATHISEALGASEKIRVGAVAPPEGLYLMQVVYPQN